jgi:hypothetical protein
MSTKVVFQCQRVQIALTGKHVKNARMKMLKFCYVIFVSNMNRLLRCSTRAEFVNC